MGWTCSEAPPLPRSDINTDLSALYVTSDLVSFLKPSPFVPVDCHYQIPPPHRLPLLSLQDSLEHKA